MPILAIDSRRRKDDQFVVVNQAVGEFDQARMSRPVVPAQPARRAERGVGHFQDRFIEDGFILVRLLVVNERLEEAAWRKLVRIPDDDRLTASE